MCAVEAEFSEIAALMRAPTAMVMTPAIPTPISLGLSEVKGALRTAGLTAGAYSRSRKAIKYDLAGFSQGHWNPVASDFGLFSRLQTTE